MLTPLRAAVAGAVLAATTLLAAPATATPSAAAGSDAVGGPDLAAKGVVVRPGPGATPLPSIDANTWLLADLTTGEVLAAKGAHTKVLPASTLKTLTAITLMPKLDPTRVVTATDFDTHAVGGHVGIVAGATYSVWDLWMGLLLPSANDAAAALAEADGGMNRTVAQMAETARTLQAYDTTPKTPSGLDTPGQYSSAYDMALFARAALQIPQFRAVTMTMSYDFPGKMPKAGATRSTYKIFTENRLLRHHYRGTVGGKTGFTSLAHRTFWGAAERGGHTLVVTLFQIKEPTETAARALLDWGFANLGKVTPVGTLVPPLTQASASPTAGSTAAMPGTNAAAATPAAVSGRAVTVAGLLAALLVLAAVVAVLLRRGGRNARRGPGRLPAPPREPRRRREPAPPAPRPRKGGVVVVDVATTDPDTAPIPVVPVQPVVTAPTAVPSNPTAAPPAAPSTGNVRVVGRDPKSP